jgi:hypothetical protein
MCLFGLKIFSCKLIQRYSKFFPNQLPSCFDYDLEQINLSKSLISWSFLNFISKIVSEKNIGKKHSYELENLMA